MIGVDEGGRRRAPGKGLDAEGARAREQVEDGGVADGVEAGEGREHRLPHPVGGRAQAAPGGRQQPSSSRDAGHDPHPGALMGQ